ncbi:MAG: LptA/OstA family protein [Thermoanaerobaculaceae bacterium]
MNAKARALRVVSGTLLVIWTASLLAILVYRHWQRRTLVTEVGVEAEPYSEQPVRVQKGFVFTYALGVSPSFRVAAKESVEFSSGWLELRTVEVTFFQRGQLAYGLMAERARLNPTKNEAVLQGEPQINFGNGIVARAQAFTLTGVERRLSSSGTTTFAGPGWGGVAGQIISVLESDEVRLANGVSVVATGLSGEPVTLLASSVSFRHKEGLMLFPEGVTVLRGKLSLEAPSGSLWLDRHGRTPQKLSLDGQVLLTGTTDTGEAVEGEFSQLEAQRADKKNILFAAGPAPNSGWATLRIDRPGEGFQELWAFRLSGVAEASGLEKLEAHELACATLAASGEAPMHLSARRLALTFPKDQPGKAYAAGDVELEREGVKIFGDEMEAALPRGPGEIWAGNRGQVRFESPTVTGACGRVSFDADGNFVASGGVQGTLQSEGKGTGAARFAAEKALGEFKVREKITLEGDARVWESQQIVRAKSIVVDRGRDLVRATGRVLTQVSREGGDWVIEAGELVYDRQKAVAEYSGDVVVQEARGTLRCQSLTAFLSERGELLRGDFRGNVVIEDTVGERKITGTAASYTSSNETMVVLGEPARVEEVSGNRVTATRIIWHRRTDNLEVGGELEFPSQTVYHPTQLATPPARGTPSPEKR